MQLQIMMMTIVILLLLVWSQSPPEFGFLPGIGVSHLTETDSRPYLSHLDFCVTLLQSL